MVRSGYGWGIQRDNVAINSWVNGRSFSSVIKYSILIFLVSNKLNSAANRIQSRLSTKYMFWDLVGI